MEVRKVSLDRALEALVVRCLQGLGTKFASFGRLVNVTVVVNVHSSIRPTAPSTKDDKRGKRKNQSYYGGHAGCRWPQVPVSGRCPSVAGADWPVPVAGAGCRVLLAGAGCRLPEDKKCLLWKKKKKDDLGSNSAKGSQSLKDKGGTPSSSGSAAVCLMRALMMVAVISHSTSTHRVPEGFASTPFY